MQDGAFSRTGTPPAGGLERTRVAAPAEALLAFATETFCPSLGQAHDRRM